MTELQTASLQAPSGLQVTVLNLGATLVSLRVPSSSGTVDTVLGYPGLESYRDDPHYLGATVGRYANRVARAGFVLDGVEYRLEANEEPAGTCLHGGPQGLHGQIFDLDVDARRITATHTSPDGSGGFPGRLQIAVVYQLLDACCLAIDFIVTSDRDTVVSLANHAYFNLGGPIGDHDIRICAQAYTPLDRHKIPTGEVRAVAGTRYDLRDMQPLRDRSYDHNFVLARPGGEPRLAAQLRSPESGLQMSVETTQAGLQFYTADHLGSPFEPRQGLCLEAQAFPDAPNQPQFPSARLAAGATLRHRTSLKFEDTFR